MVSNQSNWQIELSNMLAAFNHQGTHSLGIMKSAFDQNGLPLTPVFKQYFMQASINRLVFVQ